MNSRKTYSSDLKSRVVLEMFRDELTISQISSKLEIQIRDAMEVGRYTGLDKKDILALS